MLQVALAILAAGSVVIAVGLLALIGRRRLLEQRFGTFDCGVRRTAAAPGKARRGGGWAFGLARYRGDSVEWFRVFSLSARPRWVLVRRDLQVLARRVPKGSEAYTVANAVVLECRVAGKSLELAMSPDAVMGFMSWLEAAPPGQHLVA